MRRFTDKEKAERVELLRTWGEAGDSMADCAKRLGVTQPAVNVFVKKYGPHGVFKHRGRTKPSETPAFVQAKVAKIRELVDEGQPLSTIRSLTNMTTDQLLRFMRKHGIKVSAHLKAGQRNKFKNRDFMAAQPWQVGDPSTLRSSDLEACAKLGITPERMAWLLSCPRGTGKIKAAGLLEGGVR